jgi:tripartite-type tricarboxylate transporter receptor subunit TctC
MVSQILSERPGQIFIVDNRPGAGGNIATEMVIRAPADGYTLLVVGPPAAINPHFTEISASTFSKIWPLSQECSACPVISGQDSS